MSKQHLKCKYEFCGVINMSKQHLKCKYDPATFKLGFKWEDVIPPGYKVSNVEAEITGEEDAIVRYELHEVLVPFSS